MLTVGTRVRTSWPIEGEGVIVAAGYGRNRDLFTVRYQNGHTVGHLLSEELTAVLPQPDNVPMDIIELIQNFDMTAIMSDSLAVRLGQVYVENAILRTLAGMPDEFVPEFIAHFWADHPERGYLPGRLWNLLQKGISYLDV